ncbi:heparin lyase I family protein [Rhizobium oryzicola]|uniref:Heparin lyase I family protein n=1 Tax=Rhizobium oryzicola TaxID=1232668 RepID=A0ABT8T0D4_9HYPH|nr:heparin lyase I family protein [Rhizobium oryzicola]MDO1583613.1 heparin lyase I family protein [Rhizobium oryzicola]
MRGFFAPILLISLFACSHAVADSGLAIVSEDFSAAPSDKYWYVCHRPENSFSFGKTDDGKTAMVATVKPEPKTFAFLKEHHGSCLDEGSVYQRDGDERAEIWESDAVRLKLGADVWYRFDMFIDESLNAASKRFISGQWKEDKAARGGPLLAQRFTGGRFIITVEQDNHDPARKQDDVLCRVLIADQYPLSLSPAGWPHDDKTKDIPPRLAAGSYSTTMMMAGTTPDVAKDQGCARDINVTQYSTLPSPFGRWTTMVYHFALRPDQHAFVDIWANGHKIASVKGRIGYQKEGNRSTEYFKFGPYRDPESYETVTKLANFMRSGSRQDADPTGKLTPDGPSGTATDR